MRRIKEPRSFIQVLAGPRQTGKTTLAHYLALLKNAGLVAGLQKYAGQVVRKRASSPKLLVLNTALMNALAHRTFDDTRRKPELWGRIVESAVGAALYNGSRGQGISLHYWAASNRELDFVLTKGNDVLAIERSYLRISSG